MAQSLGAINNAIKVDTYAELDRFVESFARGHFNLLILVGGPGLQKSQNFRRALGPRVCWIEGNATPFGMYCQLWEHRDEPVVIDDVDSLYAVPSGVRLLKCLCQTDAVKTVAWHSHSAALDRLEIPREFTTTSRVAIIGNEWKTLNDNVAAVEDRGHLLLFEPPAHEVHERVKTWFDDQEILAFVEEHQHLLGRPSMRHYHKAQEFKQAGMDWRTMLLQRWQLLGPALLVARLQSDPSFRTEKDRVKAFVERGGGCRATYFNHSKVLRRILKKEGRRAA